MCFLFLRSVFLQFPGSAREPSLGTPWEKDNISRQRKIFLGKGKYFGGRRIISGKRKKYVWEKEHHFWEKEKYVWEKGTCLWERENIIWKRTNMSGRRNMISGKKTYKQLQDFWECPLQNVVFGQLWPHVLECPLQKRRFFSGQTSPEIKTK